MAKAKPSLPTRPLADLLAWWKKAKVPGVIIGGLAIAYRGVPRATRDVDAVIFLDDDRLEEFVEQGKNFSFEPRLADAVQYARRNRVLLLAHGESRTEIDLSLAGPIFEPQILERVQNVKVGKLMVPVATVEDLLVLKAVANRPIDRVDIVGLIERNDNVDLHYVRCHLEGFAHLLEMPDLIEDFNRLITPPTKRAKRRPKRKPK